MFTTLVALLKDYVPLHQMYGGDFPLGKDEELTKLFLSLLIQKFIRYYTF